MAIALLPSGRKSYVHDKLKLSVSLADSKAKGDLERVIREGLAEDPRQLFIRLQGGRGYGPWHFWLEWGHGADRRDIQPVILQEDEHSPEAVLARIKAALSKLPPSPTIV
ncbi:MAG: hypothetical protein JOY54_11290 [Acidobacteriaceae bacterium]|nr:hypothetical protein [Acidobacteriaceae bacterium]